jgi:hypothetical protein
MDECPCARTDDIGVLLAIPSNGGGRRKIIRAIEPGSQSRGLAGSGCEVYL